VVSARLRWRASVARSFFRAERVRW
jgi:hypothetical protein